MNTINSTTLNCVAPFSRLAKKNNIRLSEMRKCLVSVLFLRYLSDHYEKTAKKELGSSYPSNSFIPLETWYKENPHDIALFEKHMCRTVQYIMQPQHLWANLVKQAKTQDPNFIQTVDHCFAWIEKTSLKQSFQGIFSTSPLLYLLGPSHARRNTLLCYIILKIDRILAVSTDSDVFRVAFDALINGISHDTKKDFHTPQAISRLLSDILTLDSQEPAQGKRKFLPNILDFACGSGAVLLDLKKKMGNQNIGQIFAQEADRFIYQLARMNLFIHGVKNSDIKMFCGNVLFNEWDTFRETYSAQQPSFDVVVSVPSTMTPRWNNEGMGYDHRFKDFGTPPKSAADFAFLLHGLHFLKQDGVMVIVLHHGALFRNGIEEKIRMKLIENNVIDTIIGLPFNLFYSTGSAVCVLILKKCRKVDDVLFINARNDFEKGTHQNYLLPEHVNKIISAYQFRQEKDNYARRVSRDEIRSINYDMNLSHYI